MMEPINITNEKLFLCMSTTIDFAAQSSVRDTDKEPKIGACLALDFEPVKIANSSVSKTTTPINELLTQLKTERIADYVLFTTVGPDENELRSIIKSGVKSLFFGMHNPKVEHPNEIVKMLVENRIKFDFYQPKDVQTIEEQNQKSILFYAAAYNRPATSVFDLPTSKIASTRTLNVWYTITNRIYVDRNYTKTVYEIFCHFVEIIGGLSVLSTEKTEKLVDPENQIAKAIAWWFALNGKVGIRSVEDLVFYKFPLVCPYCEEARHDKDKCNHVKLAGKGPNWSNLIKKSQENIALRPTTISSWQQMFYDIYPVGSDGNFDYAYSRLTEELGELAEAIRCMDISPSYFLSESADLFAWLMHLSNLYESKKDKRITRNQRGEYLERKLFELYPDQCKDCGNVVCTCAPILKTTVGRISNDGPNYDLFTGVKPFLTRDEFATQFDATSESIVIANETFKVDSYFIRSVRSVSERLLIQLRKVKVSDSEKVDRVIISLQNVHSMVVTQRVNQESINRLIKSMLTLENTDRKILADEFENLEKNPVVTRILELLN